MIAVIVVLITMILSAYISARECRDVKKVDWWMFSILALYIIASGGFYYWAHILYYFHNDMPEDAWNQVWLGAYRGIAMVLAYPFIFGTTHDIVSSLSGNKTITLNSFIKNTILRSIALTIGILLI